jgi:hypothetical protein
MEERTHQRRPVGSNVTSTGVELSTAVRRARESTATTESAELMSGSRCGSSLRKAGATPAMRIPTIARTTMTSIRVKADLENDELTNLFNHRGYRGHRGRHLQSSVSSVNSVVKSSCLI